MGSYISPRDLNFLGEVSSEDSLGDGDYLLLKDEEIELSVFSVNGVEVVGIVPTCMLGKSLLSDGIIAIEFPSDLPQFWLEFSSNITFLLMITLPLIYNLYALNCNTA
ncbi:hypothetical protein ACH5RR_028737 [Cinchona calisaya]|uniref:Uncharacterized protein n=1 Tax=Cinchona calisaya TaxID=153742 RepID=A0ABD2YRV1_9GENT